MRRSTVALLIIAVAVVGIALGLRSRGGPVDTADPIDTPTSAPNEGTIPSTDPGGSTVTGPPGSSTTEPATTTIAEVLPEGAIACDLYSTTEQAGVIASDELVEASGMAISRTTPNVLWSHNDSRGEPVLFAFNGAGDDLGSFEVPGAFSLDWEDMAAGPDADGTGSFLYVGDIGDNFGIRDGLVYVWQVPDLDPEQLDGAFPASRPITLHMPGGPFDAEALFIDPVDPAIYLITKSQTEARVFRGPLTSGSAPEEMELVTTLFLDAEVSGADITADGSIIALRGYRTVWMWSRAKGQTIAAAFSADPCMAPSPDETQGEAISFDADGTYYTVSEGTNSAITRVPIATG